MPDIKEIQKEEGFWEKIARGFRKAKNSVNPKTAFLKHIKADNFAEAYKKARESGVKDFIWDENARVYSTKYDGSPQEQMETYGITDEQLINRNLVQERLAKNLRPVGYDDPAQRFVDAVVKNKKDPIRGAEEVGKIPDNYDTLEFSSARYDYFNIYMGIPQKNSTLGVSQYKPSINSGECETYCYKDKELSGYIRNNLKHVVQAYYRSEKEIGECTNKDEMMGKSGKTINGAWVLSTSLATQTEKGDDFRLPENNLGNYSMSLGKDEKGSYISYYDKWNMAAGRGLYGKLLNDIGGNWDKKEREQMYDGLQKINTDFGTPFEVYDRIYYDPKTMQPIADKEISKREEMQLKLKAQAQKSQKQAEKFSSAWNNPEKKNKEVVKAEIETFSLLSKVASGYIKLGVAKAKDYVVEKGALAKTAMQQGFQSIADKIKMLSCGEPSPATRAVVQTRLNNQLLKNQNAR